MAWFFRGVFLTLAVAMVLYAALVVKEWLQKEETVPCTLVTRRREVTTNRIVVQKKDTTSYALIFQTERGTSITVRVSQDVYRLIPKDVPGQLTHRGSIFRHFAMEDGTVHAYSLVDDPTTLS